MQWLALLTLTSLAVFLETLARHVALAGPDGKLLRVRGVPVPKSSLYSPDRDFECLDGSLLMPFDRVNDDYCDCADGSDEPGTAACANASFYCQNSGYQATYIPSSWVNDGVCDCCDASDEYSSDVQCVDNCQELGREAWLEAQRVAELAKEGNKIRLEYIQKGKQLKSENQAKLAEYRASYEEAELTKKEKEVVKTRAEEREAAALEKYKPPPPPEQEQEKEGSEEEAKEYFLLLDSDSSGTVTIVELQTRVTFDKDRNGEVSREEALFFLNNQEELTMQEFIDSAWANVKPFLMREKGAFMPTKKDGEQEEAEVEAAAQQQQPHEEPHDDSEEHEHEHEDDDHEHEDEEHEEEEGHEGQVEDANAEQQPEAGEQAAAQPQYDEETQALIDEAREARERFQEAERHARDLHNEIRQLEERAERDYGPEEVFASLDGQCFDYTDLEYVYTLCLYGKATQRSKSGGSEVNLGQWLDWVGHGPDRYSQAKLDRGLTCWNGPSRSTLVSLKCGVENKLTAVAEPNRCEYTMEFETPALCNPNAEHTTDVHDEL